MVNNVYFYGSKFLLRRMCECPQSILFGSGRGFIWVHENNPNATIEMENLFPMEMGLFEED